MYNSIYATLFLQVLEMNYVSAFNLFSFTLLWTNLSVSGKKIICLLFLSKMLSYKTFKRRSVNCFYLTLLAVQYKNRIYFSFFIYSLLEHKNMVLVWPFIFCLIIYRVEQNSVGWVHQACRVDLAQFLKFLEY